MTHYFTLTVLARELDMSLSGAVVRQVFSHQKDEIVVACGEAENNPYSRVLNVSIVPRFNSCVLRCNATRAKRNSADLFGKLRGSRVERIAMVPFNRVMVVEFSNKMSIMLRLFNTAESNVIVVDEAGSVLYAFKNEKELIGGRYQACERIFDSRCLTDVLVFSEQMAIAGQEKVAGSLKKIIPFLGPTYAREALFRSGIDEQLLTCDLTANDYQSLFDSVRAAVDEVSHPRPVVYISGEKNILSVVPLHHLCNAQAESFDFVNDAIRSCIGQAYHTFGIDREKKRYLSALHKECARARRKLEAMEQELGEAGRAEAYEQLGNIIIANLHQLTKGATQAELPDLFVEHATVRVSLNPTLTPVQNAERYFGKSKRAKAARVQTGERRLAIDKKISLLEQMIQSLDRSETQEEIKAFADSYQKELTHMKLAGETDETDRPPFRIFSVAGGIEVWVGKNSANNDLLTMKNSKPNDLWFHARGASGSHTVLKCHGAQQPPGKEAIRQAAAIAAYYSKMRKATHVPVAYCERKYVRKPKGVPHGTVTLEREKVIFVDPRLPERSSEEESEHDL